MLKEELLQVVALINVAASQVHAGVVSASAALTAAKMTADSVQPEFELQISALEQAAAASDINAALSTIADFRTAYARLDDVSNAIPIGMAGQWDVVASGLAGIATQLGAIAETVEG